MGRQKNSQITNYYTYMMKLRQCKALAENVFCYENLPLEIDVAYMNQILVNKGAIAFFKDEILRTYCFTVHNIWKIRCLR